MHDIFGGMARGEESVSWIFWEEALIAATRLPHRVQGAFAELGVDSTRFPWHRSSRGGGGGGRGGGEGELE